MKSWSILAGRIFGVELRIHLSFVFLLFFVWLTESAAHGNASAARGLALVAIIFGCVILHELGHALVGRHAGIRAKAIILLPIGGVTLLDETQQPLEPGTLTWKRDIRIALAGPLVNLVIAVVSAGMILLVAPRFQLWVRPYLDSSNLPRSLVWANLWLAGSICCLRIRWMADACCVPCSAAAWTRFTPHAAPFRSAKLLPRYLSSQACCNICRAPVLPALGWR